ncbi:hypothetical protein D3C76_878740 [compost metagenome]
MADESRVQGAEAVAGEVEVGDRQAGVLGAHRLHDAVEVVRVFGREAGRGVARSGGHEVVAGRRGQLHHVIAGAVEESLEAFGVGAGVMTAGAGDHEDQRGRVVLPGQAVTQLLHRPEVVRQLVFPFRAQLEVVVGLVDVLVHRHLVAQLWRSGGDGSLEGVGDRKAVALRIQVCGQRLGTEDQATQQGGEAKSKHRKGPCSVSAEAWPRRRAPSTPPVCRVGHRGYVPYKRTS